MRAGRANANISIYDVVDFSQVPMNQLSRISKELPGMP